MDTKLIELSWFYLRELEATIRLEGNQVYHIHPNAKIHRIRPYNIPLARFVFDQWKESGFKDPKKQLGLIYYLTDDECALHEVAFTPSGKIVKKENIVADGEYLYVLTSDNRLRLHKSGRLENGARICHSSLSQGSPVRAAGELEVKNGRLVYINGSSGHYKPRRSAMAQLIAFLQRQKADLRGTELEFKTDTTRERVFTTAQAFISSSKRSFSFWRKG